jgi:cysteine synthase
LRIRRSIVGGTPLVRINRLAKSCPAQVVAKLEFYSPGASVKWVRCNINL